MFVTRFATRRHTSAHYYHSSPAAEYPRKILGRDSKIQVSDLFTQPGEKSSIGRDIKAAKDISSQAISTTAKCISSLDTQLLNIEAGKKKHSDLYLEVKNLIVKGLSINEILEDGSYYLHRACKQNDYDTVELLIKNNADMNSRDADGLTSLNLAEKLYIKELYTAEANQRLQFVYLLQNNGAEKFSDLYLEIENLIKRGKSVNETQYTPSIHRTTYLHMACKEKDYKAVVLLIKNGADVNATDHTGSTPLLMMCDNYNENFKDEILKIVDELISNKADVNKKNHNGFTPLYKAAENSSYLTKLLLDAGADQYVEYNGIFPAEKPYAYPAERPKARVADFDLEFFANNKKGISVLLFKAIHDGDLESLERLWKIAKGDFFTGDVYIHKLSREYTSEYTPFFYAINCVLFENFDCDKAMEICKFFADKIDVTTITDWDKKALARLEDSKKPDLQLLKDYVFGLNPDFIEFARTERVELLKEKFKEDRLAVLETIAEMAIKSRIKEYHSLPFWKQRSIHYDDFINWK